jgi:arylsulfatase A
MKIPYILVCLLLLAAPPVHSQNADRPNILLILLDDAGWTDLQCYGSRIQTPHMNRLADQGMRFTDCHSPAPNCSPSRAGLLTGRSPIRAGIYSYLPANHVMHLRDQEVTLAERLKEAGYATGHFGKWHLSRLQSTQPGPREQGFDDSLGTDNNASPSHKDPVNFVRNGLAIGKQEGYSCDIVSAEAIRWIKQNTQAEKHSPFFACVWFHEPHAPIASPAARVAKYQSLYPELTKKQATYYANIENVDHAIGTLLQTLDEIAEAENTFVFLTSDNGPLNDFSRVGLRGKKSNVWEGGHRVPGIFRWPGRIKPGTVSHELISGLDFFPTVCDLAGIPQPKRPKLDGISLEPLLTGKQETLTREQPLYWFFYRLNPALAIRSGKWSLIANSNDAQRPKAHPLVREDMPFIKSSQPTDFRLYDLASDQRQQVDVSDRYPAIFERLKQQLIESHSEIVAEGPEWEIPASYGSSNQRKLWNSE